MSRWWCCPGRSGDLSRSPGQCETMVDRGWGEDGVGRPEDGGRSCSGRRRRRPRRTPGRRLPGMATKSGDGRTGLFGRLQGGRLTGWSGLIVELCSGWTQGRRGNSGGPPPGSGWARWAVRTADSSPQVTTPTTRAGGRMVCWSGLSGWVSVGKRRDRASARTFLDPGRNVKVKFESAEQEGPARLSGTEPLRIANVREVLVVRPD